MRTSLSLAEITGSGLVLLDALSTVGAMHAPELWEPLKAAIAGERAARSQTEGDRQSVSFEVPLLPPEQAAAGLDFILKLLTDIGRMKPDDTKEVAIFFCRLAIELRQTLKAVHAVN